jgi:hypothetical protein
MGSDIWDIYYTILLNAYVFTGTGITDIF